MVDGLIVVVDEVYLCVFICDLKVCVVKGFVFIMLIFDLSE